MRTACDRVHAHKHMQNEVIKDLISMDSKIVNKQVNYCQKDQQGCLTGSFSLDGATWIWHLTNT